MHSDIPPITAWSYSSLKKFEKCPYSVYLSKVAKIPTKEPEKSSPLVRGTRIHQEAEDFVCGKLTDFPASLKKFKDDFSELRELYMQGMVTLEEDWGIDHEWGPTGWTGPDTWGRMKLDAFVQLDEGAARVIDYKTGKSWGNEVPHTQQAQVYTIATFMRYPDLNYISAEFWYIDEGKTTKRTYDRNKINRYVQKITDRAKKMTQATQFPPKPNAINCKWCEYGRNVGNSECAFGV